MWAKLDPEIVQSRIKMVEKYKSEKNRVSQTDFCMQNNIKVTQLRDWQCLYNKQIKKFVPVTVVEAESKPIPDNKNSDEHCILEYGDICIRFISEASLKRIPGIISEVRKICV